jgi:phage-related holin
MGHMLSIGWPTMTDSQQWAVVLACLMMLFDILAGFLGACIRHDVSSTKMRDGIGHKCLELVFIAISYILGAGLAHVSGMNISVPSTEVVCGYIIVMELASVIENVGKSWPEFSDTQLYGYFRKIVGDDK